MPLTCYKCSQEKSKLSTVLVMPTLKLWKFVLCENPQVWKDEIENCMAQGFYQVEICDDCIKEMLCIR